MCSYAVKCPKKLVEHCLAEIEDNQKFSCSRCGVTEDLQHWTMLSNSEHECHKHDRNFDILMTVTPLVDLKTLLKLGPKIDPSVVDHVLRETGWTEPANPTLEPPRKRRRVLRAAHFDHDNRQEVRSIVVKPKETVPKLKDLENVCPPNVSSPHPCCLIILMIWGLNQTFNWTLRSRT